MENTEAGDNDSSIIGRLGARSKGSARYRIDNEIARGGMGAILSVWDDELHRELAMKVALGSKGSGSSASVNELDERILSRFLEEAQITGQLEHPGIVPVHELGLDENGRLYFTMPLVRGRDLESVFGSVARGEDDWTVTRALGALLRAAEALTFAHSKGVIHRDLKPANIMVGEFGEVYVMDWGLARVLGKRGAAPKSTGTLAVDPRQGSRGGSRDGLYTMAGDVLGTPAYIPPEQARGELDRVDERSDVYAFGAMLYRLLAGAAPYSISGKRRTAGEVLAALYEGPPTPLAELATDSPAELIAISSKAMEREADDRYASMEALANDLRAFLEGRVVSAFETGTFAEARKWVRRNRALSAALAGGILALAAGLGFSLIERARADRSARIAEETNAFLNDELLAAVSPELEGIDVTVREVLDAASERLAGRFPDEPEIEAALSATLGETYERLGEDELAEAHLARAYELSALIHGESDERTRSTAVALASVQAKAGKFEPALAALRKALEAQRSADGDDHKQTLDTQARLAQALSVAGLPSEAKLEFEAVLAAQRRVLGDDNSETLTSANNLAIVLQALGEYDAAGSLLEKTLDQYLSLFGPEHPQTINTYANLAENHKFANRWDESEKLQLATLATREEVLGPDHPSTAVALGNLGTLYHEIGRVEEAEELFRRAHALLSRNLPADHPQVILATSNLGTNLSAQGRLDEALELLEPILQVQLRVLGPDHPGSLLTLDVLAGIHRHAGRYDEAERLFREALEGRRRVLGPDAPDTLMTLENLSNVFYSRKDYEECREMLEEVLEGRIRALGPEHHDVAKTTFNLGMLSRSLREFEEAEELFVDSADIFRVSAGDEHVSLANALGYLGDVRRELKDFAGAVDAYADSVVVREAIDPAAEETAKAQYDLAYVQYRGELYKDALASSIRSLATREAIGDSKMTAVSRYLLAKTYQKLKRIDEAKNEALAYEALVVELDDEPSINRAQALLRELASDD